MIRWSQTSLERHGVKRDIVSSIHFLISQRTDPAHAGSKPGVQDRPQKSLLHISNQDVRLKLQSSYLATREAETDEVN